METEASPAPSAKPPKSRLRRWTVKIVRGAILVYLGIVIVIYFLQTKLIFPGASTQGDRGSILRASQTSEILTLTAPGGEKITAIFGKALDANGQLLPDYAHRPTMVYFYGNASCMADSSNEFDHFRRLGVNVIVPDYLGYGMSEGKASEANCYATADAAYDYLLTRRDIDPDKIVAVGWSLGAAVAIDLASRKHVAGLITFSAFSKMSDMAHLVIPWIPTSLILRHRFDNLKKIPTIACPIMIAHGTVDTIVPPEMSARLVQAAKSHVTKIDVVDGNHNDIFEAGGEPLMESVGKFLDQIK